MVDGVDLSGYVEQWVAIFPCSLGPDLAQIPTRRLFADDEVCSDFGRLGGPGVDTRDRYVQNRPCKIHRRDLTRSYEMCVSNDW